MTTTSESDFFIEDINNLTESRILDCRYEAEKSACVHCTAHDIICEPVPKEVENWARKAWAGAQHFAIQPDSDTFLITIFLTNIAEAVSYARETVKLYQSGAVAIFRDSLHRATLEAAVVNWDKLEYLAPRIQYRFPIFLWWNATLRTDKAGQDRWEDDRKWAMKERELYKELDRQLDQVTELRKELLKQFTKKQIRAFDLTKIIHMDISVMAARKAWTIALSKGLGKLISV
ncbi:MAG: hypothetical protein M1814_001744 [Vezdaea aestivalis]|nr:MAG: hypothetical protein M1814_001744 [Vezdaea aestivalis]